MTDKKPNADGTYMAINSQQPSTRSQQPASTPGASQQPSRTTDTGSAKPPKPKN